MSAPSVNIASILNELAAGLGRDAVRAACVKFASGKAAPVEAAKPKKEKKERGPSSWNLVVAEVLEEMRAAASATAEEGKEEAAAKAVTYKMAFAEASRRKRVDDPEAQAKYDVYRLKLEEKRAAKKAAKAAAAPAAAAPVTAPAPVAAPAAAAPVAPAPAAAPAAAPVAAPPAEVAKAAKGAGRPKKA